MTKQQKPALCSSSEMLAEDVATEQQVKDDIANPSKAATLERKIEMLDKQIFPLERELFG